MSATPCGYCTKCKQGNPMECYFPSFGQKSFSSQTSTSLSQWGARDFTPLSGSKSIDTYKKCADTHPGLVIPVAGTEKTVTVFGGSASYPVHKDCDIYVALDKYASAHGINKYPWNGTVPIRFTFGIDDMKAPDNSSEFKKMVAWLKEQAIAGKKIHAGCASGHGRTGTLFAALVKEIGGIDDAITYVREHYCKKAVESRAQVQFLAKHFGIKGIKGSKEYVGGSFESGWTRSESRGEKSFESRAERFNRKYGKSSDDVAYPVKWTRMAGNIWGIHALEEEEAL